MMNEGNESGLMNRGGRGGGVWPFFAVFFLAHAGNKIVCMYVRHPGPHHDQHVTEHYQHLWEFDITFHYFIYTYEIAA